MHISSTYTQARALAEQIGELSLPPLANSPGRPSDSKFTEEINRTGVYVHKLSHDLDALQDQIKKLSEHRFPTPGTFVGVGLHSVYNHFRWKNTSGLVFRPDTVSVLLYKGDIASIRRSHLGSIDQGVPSINSERYRDYAADLSQAFDTLGETVTAFNKRAPKKLRLVEDVLFAREKYRELELRSNGAFRIKKPGRTLSDDVSSKHVIARLLNVTTQTVTVWTKDTLLHELNARSAGNDRLGQLLAHAIRKIERFDNDNVLYFYLNRRILPPSKFNYYVETARELGAQTPNEHLLMPRMTDVLGVCVNFESLVGIDQAFEINTTLRKHQRAKGADKHDHPALVYQISAKIGSSLIQAGWSQHVKPWSSSGLIEFAKTGLITGVDNNRFRPDHFKVLALIAQKGALVLNDNRQVTGYGMPANFVRDLSTVRDNGDNLLHIVGIPLCIARFGIETN